MRRIGILMSLAANDRGTPPRVLAFKEGLRRFGWVEERNIHVEFRWGAGNRDLARNYAAELVAHKPDVVVGVDSLNVRAISQVTRRSRSCSSLSSTQLVTVLVASLRTPGGNITGSSSYEPSMMGKWLQLLKEVVPAIRRVTVIFNPATAAFNDFMQPLRSVAVALGLEIVEVALRDAADIGPAIAGVAQQPAAALFVIPDNFTITRRETVVEAASRYRPASTVLAGTGLPRPGLLCSPHPARGREAGSRS
jgi:putative tryptophan/tyrosine transport system substrate-binding protein